MTTDHTDNNKPQLKPCPCCAALPQTLHDYKCFDGGSNPGWKIRCDNCGLQTCWWHSLEEAIQKWNSRVNVDGAAPRVDNQALIQLLEAALVNPQSAESNIRQVIELLATTATAAPAEQVCKCGLPKDDQIHLYTTEWQQMHKFTPKAAPVATTGDDE